MERGVPGVSRSGHPVWLCYGTFTIFFYTLWGAIVDGARDRYVSVRPSCAPHRTCTHTVHVAMLVEDHGVTSACTFASPPPGPSECVLLHAQVCVHMSVHAQVCACASGRLRFRAGEGIRDSLARHSSLIIDLE